MINTENCVKEKELDTSTIEIPAFTTQYSADNTEVTAQWAMTSMPESLRATIQYMNHVLPAPHTTRNIDAQRSVDNEYGGEANSSSVMQTFLNKGESQQLCDSKEKMGRLSENSECSCNNNCATTAESVTTMECNADVNQRTELKRECEKNSYHTPHSEVQIATDHAAIAENYNKNNSINSVTVRVPAKTNLWLSVQPLKHGETMHTLDTLYVGVGLYDEVTVSRNKRGEGWSFTIESDYLDESTLQRLRGEQNLAVQAMKAFAHATNTNTDIDIHVTKNIPLAAGMGGGSADAAGVIVALNALLNTQQSLASMHAIAAPLGADIPFCITSGIAHGSGIGEIITAPSTQDLLFLCNHHLLGTVVIGIVHAHLSTPEVYRTFDTLVMQKSARPNASANLNDLQESSLQLNPQASALIDTAITVGATQAFISGSGPTVVAIAPNSAIAEQIAQAWESNPHIERTVRTTMGDLTTITNYK